MDNFREFINKKRNQILLISLFIFITALNELFIPGYIFSGDMNFLSTVSLSNFTFDKFLYVFLNPFLYLFPGWILQTLIFLSSFIIGIYFYKKLLDKFKVKLTSFEISFISILSFINPFSFSLLYLGEWRILISLFLLPSFLYQIYLILFDGDSDIRFMVSLIIALILTIIYPSNVILITSIYLFTSIHQLIIEAPSTIKNLKDLSKKSIYLSLGTLLSLLILLRLNLLIFGENISSRFTFQDLVLGSFNFSNFNIDFFNSGFGKFIFVLLFIIVLLGILISFKNLFKRIKHFIKYKKLDSKKLNRSDIFSIILFIVFSSILILDIFSSESNTTFVSSMIFFSSSVFFISRTKVFLEDKMSIFTNKSKKIQKYSKYFIIFVPITLLWVLFTINFSNTFNSNFLPSEFENLKKIDDDKQTLVLNIQQHNRYKWNETPMINPATKLMSDSIITKNIIDCDIFFVTDPFDSENFTPYQSCFRTDDDSEDFVRTVKLLEYDSVVFIKSEEYPNLPLLNHPDLKTITENKILEIYEITNDF